MCPTNADVHPGDEMVPVDVSGAPPVAHSVNGANGHSNGTNGTSNGHSNGQSNGHAQRPTNPYAPRYADFLSNVSNFKIIESTLRGNYCLFTRVISTLNHLYRGRAIRQRFL